jgi:argininosuccinate synthase
VCWLQKNGAIPIAYTADLGQPDEADIGAVAERAKMFGAQDARVVDCKRPLASAGLSALRCGAIHVTTAGKSYFNTTPLGRAVAGSILARRMHEDGVRIWSDGSTYKGNDIERFYRYALLVDRELRFYKPWLDATFVEECPGREEMIGYLERAGKRFLRQGERAYSTDVNLLGATHEAEDLERLNVSMEIVEPIMGVKFWDETVQVDVEDVSIAFVGGIPIEISGVTCAGPLEVMRAANAVGMRHGLGMSDQIENRIVGAKSRGVYEAPGMALLHIAYERLVTAIHNEETIDVYRSLGRRLGGYLYAGRWFDPEALMIRDSLERWFASIVTGEVVIRLRRGDDYTFINTSGPELSYDSRRLSMDRVEDEPFTAADRVGQLRIGELDLTVSRDKLALYERLGILDDAIRNAPTS